MDLWSSERRWQELESLQDDLLLRLDELNEQIEAALQELNSDKGGDRS